jgi:DNA gyrase subunit B
VKVRRAPVRGQTKTKLGNNEVSRRVNMSVSEMLENYLEEHPRDAKQIVDKVILAARRAMRPARPATWCSARARSTGGGLPGKLADCSLSGPQP